MDDQIAQLDSLELTILGCDGTPLRTRVQRADRRFERADPLRSLQDRVRGDPGVDLEQIGPGLPCELDAVFHSLRGTSNFRRSSSKTSVAGVVRPAFTSANPRRIHSTVSARSAIAAMRSNASTPITTTLGKP